MVFWSFVACWSLWLLQALLGVLQVSRLSRRVGRRSDRSQHVTDWPRAAIILPLKGVDLELPLCLRALASQDYPDYELICVVEDESDPAYAMVLRELEGCKRPWRVIKAGQAGPREGQKIHNQLTAIAELDRSAAEDDVLAFADSDIVPGEHWLADLVSPLLGGASDVTTGYRWLLPAGQPPTLASHLASVINSSVACLHRFRKFETAWGGSMAMQVRTARTRQLTQWLSQSLTDDLQITRMCRSFGGRLRFVPSCLLITPVEFTLASLWEFAVRQYVLTRTCLPRLWLYGLVTTGLYTLGFVSSLGYALTAAALGWPRMHWAAPAGFLAAVTLLDAIRGSFRARLVQRAFGDEVAGRLARALWLDRWATPVWMAMHLAFILAAGTSNRIRWRSILYQVNGPQDVVRLERS